ncbi:hypothetical protein NEOLI_002172 [Neolecta irregularis DAH-3]|uniref:Uncharacterized protein n=1 Tax=Neolecta irregularis (strain DAH-3) TaxID=1198029 RepID=A0A1U7LSI4_NEOID|nr:hypothetical protein NEOLI_002172 [Neolecta irregularis DAH-3]|eukprot:OLL25543.1 hypothetical protein NEOLI_002172 [Neolecta irregularis DAH-3]
MTSFFDAQKHLFAAPQRSTAASAWESKSKLPPQYDSSLAFASQNAEIDKLADDYRTHKAISRRESVPVIGSYGRLYDNGMCLATLPSRHFSIHDSDGFRKPAVDLYNQRSSSTTNLSGFYASQRAHRAPEQDHFARRASVHQMNAQRHIYTQPFMSERIPSPGTFEEFPRDEFRGQVFSPGRLTRKGSLHSDGSEYTARFAETPREASPRGFFDPFGSAAKSSLDLHTITPLPPSRSRTNSGTASSPSPRSAKFDFFAGTSSVENHTSPSSSDGSPSRTPANAIKKPAPIGTREVVRQNPAIVPAHRDDQPWTTAMWAGKGAGVTVGASDSCW